MKKNAKSNGFILILSVLALVMACSLESAGQEQDPESSATVSSVTIPMVDESGNIVMVEKPPIPLRPLTPEETRALQDALQNPGQKVFAGQPQVFFEKIDFWHIVEVKKYSVFVICQDDRPQIVQEANVVRGEAFLAPHKVFCLAAMVLMIVSNAAIALFLKWRKGSFIAFAFAFAAAFAAAAAVAAFAAAFAAAVAFAAADEKDIKFYGFFSAVFYLLIAVILVV